MTEFFLLKNGQYRVWQQYMKLVVFTPQALRALRVLFSPMASRSVFGQSRRVPEKTCLGSISETMIYKMLILGRYIGGGGGWGVGVGGWGGGGEGV